MAIFVGGQSLTTAVEPSKERLLDSVEVPLLPLAAWLTQNIRAIAYEEAPVLFRGDVDLHQTLRQWRAEEPPRGVAVERWEDDRYDWYCRHFWMVGAEGSMVPDLAFVRSDERLWISWSRPRFAGARKLDFIAEPSVQAIPWQEAWPAMRDFVAYVAAESRAKGLALPQWGQHEDPLSVAVRCDSAQFLQLVAPQSLPAFQRLSLPAGLGPEESVALQAIRDLDWSQSAEETMSAVLDLDQRTAAAAPGRLIDELRIEVQSALQPDDPLQSGYEAARWLRRNIGLNGGPLSTGDLHDWLDLVADVHDVESASMRNDAIIGKQQGHRGVISFMVHERTRRPWAARMELARAAGHLVMDAVTPCGVLGTATSRATAGYRRKRSGAFAAELICPVAGMEQRLAGRDPSQPEVFEDIMQHFGAGALTTVYQMWNHRLLHDPEDRDALIAQFASRDTLP